MGRSFPGSCAGVSWCITLYISSTDYTGPLGYFSVVYTCILPILRHHIGIIPDRYVHHHAYSNHSHKEWHPSTSQLLHKMPSISDYLIAICFNWILASTSRAFDKFYSHLLFTPCLPPHHVLRQSHKVCIELHGVVPSMKQFRLLDRPNPLSGQAHTASLTPHGVLSHKPSGDKNMH
jgi:hypothetical protein